MENKFFSLGAIYIYYGYGEGMEQIRNVDEFITSVKPFGTFSTAKRIRKKMLKTNFGITNRESVNEMVNYYLSKEYFSVLLSILIDLYIEKPKEFTELEDSIITDFLSDEYLLKKMDQSILSKKDVSMIRDLYYDVKEYYEEQKYFLNELFSEYDILLPLCKNVSIAGFDYVRIFDIISTSYSVKHLTESETTYLLNKVGAFCKNKFNDWQEYLSSILLGKLFYTLDGMVGNTITKPEDFMLAIYRFITDDRINNCQKNIWTQNNCDDLERYLAVATAKTITKKNTNEEFISLKNMKDYRVLLAPNWKVTYEKNFSFSLEGDDGGFIGVHINNQLDYDSWQEFYEASLEVVKDSYGDYKQSEEIHSEDCEGNRLYFEQKSVGMKFIVIVDILKCNTTYNMKILSIQPSLLENSKHEIMLMLNSIVEVK